MLILFAGRGEKLQGVHQPPLYENMNCLSDCGITTITTTNSTNTITSPNYPDDYPIWTTVFYTMTAPPGQSVNLKFLEFDIEYGGSTCENDWVMILNSDGEEPDPQQESSPPPPNSPAQLDPISPPAPAPVHCVFVMKAAPCNNRLEAI